MSALGRRRAAREGREGAPPEFITADNGTEFMSKAPDTCAFERGVKLDFTTPGRPTENGFVESFQGRLRDEWEIFEDLPDANGLLDALSQPHSGRRRRSCSTPAMA